MDSFAKVTRILEQNDMLVCEFLKGNLSWTIMWRLN